MQFDAPHWFFLFALLLVAGVLWRLPFWRYPLRLALIVLIVFLLTEPRWKRSRGGLELWVLLDRSASADAVVSPQASEWLQILESSRPGGDAALRVVDFASVVTANREGQITASEREKGATRLSLALQHILARSDRNVPTRIALFSDGYSTEPLEGLAEKFLNQGVELFYRALDIDQEGDRRIARFQVPTQVAPAEPFLLDVAVEGRGNEVVDLIVQRNGVRIYSQPVTLQGGAARVRLQDRVQEPGAHHYRVSVSSEGENISENNAMEQWVEVRSARRLLLVTSLQDDPLARILRGWELEVISDPEKLHPGKLAGVSTVILHNVPAHAIPTLFLESLDFFVREQGGGLLMVGGKQSFGAGGYFESPLDPLLPVSLELKSEHRKMLVAMAIVLDRSGSMAAEVGEGKTKMDLASMGAARAVELLGNQDFVSVLAVDSEAHVAIPLSEVGPQRSSILRRVRRIQSEGGGIFVFEGLKAAWEQLRQVPVGQRHIILFADAADAEEPAGSFQLIEEMVANGGSLSIIGLGSPSDADAELLRDLAAHGQGRVFFQEDARALPQIFAQETVAVARSTFIEEQTAIVDTGAWLEFANRPWKNFPAIDGYNLSYLREGASCALRSGDEYRAPLVAFWQRGRGKSAAVCFPLGGSYSQNIRGWSGYGDFGQTLLRWLGGEALPPEIGLRTKIDGDRLRIDLFFDEDRGERGEDYNASLKFTTDDDPTATREVVWKEMEPGHFRAEIGLEDAKIYRGAIQVDGGVIPIGPVTLGRQVEFEFDPKRLNELRQLAAATGGGEIGDLSQLWQMPDGQGQFDLRPILLVVILALLVLEAVVTRWGFTHKIPHLFPDRWPTLRRVTSSVSPLEKRSASRRSESNADDAKSKSEAEIQDSPRDIGRRLRRAKQRK